MQNVVDSLLFGKYTSGDITQFLLGPMSTSYESKILPTDKKSLGLVVKRNFSMHVDV